MTGTRAHSGAKRKLAVCTGTLTVFTLAVRELLGGFQDRALERLVSEALGGISAISTNLKRG